MNAKIFIYLKKEPIFMYPGGGHLHNEKILDDKKLFNLVWCLLQDRKIDYFWWVRDGENLVSQKLYSLGVANTDSPQYYIHWKDVFYL